MKNTFLKYNLEIFSALVLIFILVNILFLPGTSYIQKLAMGYSILAILHEFEEKKIPGGFYELMAKKFGMPLETTDFNLASFFVICYWTVLIVLSYAFDGMVIFIVMPIALGIFEAFVHTAGIWLHKMKKPYTPGLVSAWLMAALSIYSIHYLNTNSLATGTDYLIGTLLMMIGFIIMQRGTLYTANMTYKDVRNNIKKMLSSK